jgi:hypothetical protein
MVDKRSPMPIARRQMHRKLVVLVQVWGDTFFHFVNEGLHRLMQVYDLIMADSETEILTFLNSDGESKLAFTRQFFELLGIDPSRLVQYRRGFEYFADVLIVPSAIPCGRAPPTLTARLHTHFASAIQRIAAGAAAAAAASATTTAPNPHQAVPISEYILFVNRQQGAQRHISNFDSVLAAVKHAFPTQHFVPFLGETTSVQQSIDLFRRAKIIIAPHGMSLPRQFNGRLRFAFDTPRC